MYMKASTVTSCLIALLGYLFYRLKIIVCSFSAFWTTLRFHRLAISFRSSCCLACVSFMRVFKRLPELQLDGVVAVHVTGGPDILFHPGREGASEWREERPPPAANGQGSFE